jgi:tRNA threonylcarbamoyl adenosine modification protein YeaZ/ribosomal-protein-alanine acetyltransferase
MRIDLHVLAIDTALASCSACVYDSEKKIILVEERVLMERGHAEALPPMVARVMAAAQITYGDLGRIAVTTGPGTFTGIRIGLSFARALGLARNIKVLGVNSMLATQVAVSESDLPIVVAHKAGASDFIYVLNSNKIEVLTMAALLPLLPQGPALIIGTAADAIVSASGRNDLKRSPHHDLPSASGFAAYAAEQPEPEAMPDPIYLREADAKAQTTFLRGLPDLDVHVVDAAAIPILAKLHATCFEEAWDEAALSTLLGSPGCGALLAQSAEGPVGLLVYRCVVDEAEILTLGVDPNLRRRGAGRALLDALIASLQTFKIKTLFLEVASSNDDAIALYTRAGFTQAGLRKAYYARTGDDALILRRALP